MTGPIAPETRDLLQSVADLVIASLPRILVGRSEVTWKADGSPVTAADTYVEGLVRDFLMARIPDLSFVGEESFGEASSLQGRFLALLDPIDGTENFCSGLKEWGTSFGLWCEGRHLGSLLLLPELGDRLMSGERIARHRSRISGFSSSYCDEIGEAIAATRESRIFGCAVYNLYNVARGAFSRFSNPKGAYAWDLLPGVMLCLEQGCDVSVDGSRFDGRFLDPHRRYSVDIRHRHDLHPG